MGPVNLLLLLVCLMAASASSPACECDPRGSLPDIGCDELTGNCHCKRNVVGRNCDWCPEQYWGLSEHPDGCKPCNCDPGGAYDNNCDIITGQCMCRPNLIGLTCSEPREYFYGGLLDYLVYEAETANIDPRAQIVVREPYRDGRNTSWTGPGFTRVFENSSIEFDVDNIERSLDYDLVVRYEPQSAAAWDNVRATLIRDPEDPVDPSGKCGAAEPRDDQPRDDQQRDDQQRDNQQRDDQQRDDQQRDDQQRDDQQRDDQQRDHQQRDDQQRDDQQRDDQQRLILSSDRRYVTGYPPICLEKYTRYKVRLEFEAFGNQDPSRNSTRNQEPSRNSTRNQEPSRNIGTLIDSIALIPRVAELPIFDGSEVAALRKQEFDHYRCSEYFYQADGRGDMPEACSKHMASIGYYVFEGAKECNCDRTGSQSPLCDPLGGQCRCKPNVVGRRCDQCSPGTYGFGPEGCTACECNAVGSLDNFCDRWTGQCQCRPNTYGRSCDKCQPGFWNYPDCQRCDCNGHAPTCEPRTGVCIDCADHTAGHHCQVCEETYYGDPRLGVDIPYIPCRACPCPNTVESGHSFAGRCYLDPTTGNALCECREGHAGTQCDKCANNYFGNPEVPGGSCQPCDCSNDVDPSLPGNCDAATGECLQFDESAYSRLQFQTAQHIHKRPVREAEWQYQKGGDILSRSRRGLKKGDQHVISSFRHIPGKALNIATKIVKDISMRDCAVQCVHFSCKAWSHNNATNQCRFLGAKEKYVAVPVVQPFSDYYEISLRDLGAAIFSFILSGAASHEIHVSPDQITTVTDPLSQENVLTDYLEPLPPPEPEVDTTPSPVDPVTDPVDPVDPGSVTPTPSTVTPTPKPDHTHQFDKPSYHYGFPEHCGTRPTFGLSDFERLLEPSGHQERTRVVGGTVVATGTYPWQAQIEVSNERGTGYEHSCGGIVISDDLILTAAHCHTKHESNYQIRVAQNDLRNPDDPDERVLAVENIIKHSGHRPDFQQGQRNDIAMMRLKFRRGEAHGLSFSDYIQPLCLPEQNTTLVVGQECQISGWGLVDAKHPKSAEFASRYLRGALVNILDPVICRRAYGDRFDERLMICAGKEEGGVDTCSGDSGGPLSCRDSFGRWFAAGVVSFGWECGAANHPGVYTRVGAYLEFLHRTAAFLTGTPVLV